MLPILSQVLRQSAGRVHDGQDRLRVLPVAEAGAALTVQIVIVELQPGVLRGVGQLGCDGRLAHAALAVATKIVFISTHLPQNRSIYIIDVYTSIRQKPIVSVHSDVRKAATTISLQGPLVLYQVRN